MAFSSHCYLDQKSLEKKHFQDSQSLKKIFFFRICGSGMAAAACLLKEAGFEVSGGDILFSPPISTYLESTDIPLKNLNQINEEELRKYDLIVVGNVVSSSSGDARLIERSRVPFCSFPAALGAFILGDKKVIGIAGTHGKTTTSYFMVQLFEALGEEPGYFVGGVIPQKMSSRLGKSSYFFIESDEYDSAYFEKISKFRLYKIDRLILTSLEFDHADIFQSIEDIKNEFRNLLPQLKTEVVFDQNYKNSIELLNEYPHLKKISYGGEENLRIIEETPQKTQFELFIEGVFYPFETNIMGWHNILNLSSCLLTAFLEGFSIKDLQRGVQDLKMVKRRQEKKGFFKGALFYDDFAHHPRSVHYTIESIKLRHLDKEIYVVWEPNSATARSALFQQEFSQSLKKADRVFIVRPQKDTSVKKYGNIDCDSIAQFLNRNDIPSRVVDSLESLVGSVKEMSSHKNIWLILSNGTCMGFWESQVAQELNKALEEGQEI